MDETVNHISQEERKVLEKLPGYEQIFYYHDGAFRLELMTEDMYHAVGVSKEDTLQYYENQRDELVHPNDRQKLYDAMHKAMEAEAEECLDLRLRKIGGHRYQWYRTGISIRKLGDDEALIYLSFVNINDLQARNEIQEEEHKSTDLLLETILDTTQTPIFWKDDRRRFAGANRAFLDYFGFSSEEIIMGKTDEEMKWHPDPGSFMDDEQSVLNGESTYLVHGKCRCRGEVRDILSSMSPIYRNGKIIGLVGSFVDVTERYRQDRKISALNDQLNTALERERISARAINEFLSRMSYEIRTPMNAVIGLSHLAMDKTEENPTRDYLEKIAVSGEYLLGILNDVLDLRKIEGGDITLMPSRCSIHEILNTAGTLTQPLAKSGNVTFTISEEGIRNRYGICDQKRVEQILINLLSNAVKFTDPGGRVELSVKQEFLSDRMRVTFVVKDTGCGMSPEFLVRLFEPFSQENRDPGRYGAGTGLGLAIARRFARLMGGDIIADSREGIGSTFEASVMFGLCSQEEIEQTRKEEQSVQESDTALKGKKVLIAEDNELNIEVATAILEQINIQVETAANGREALDKFNQSQVGDYAAILMDLQMPVMDGYEATQQIRSMNRADASEVPIIAMSADVLEESVRKAMGKGMDGYISKPINHDQLFRTLKKLIRTEKSRN